MPRQDKNVSAARSSGSPSLASSQSQEAIVSLEQTNQVPPTFSPPDGPAARESKGKKENEQNTKHKTKYAGGISQPCVAPSHPGMSHACMPQSMYAQCRRAVRRRKRKEKHVLLKPVRPKSARGRQKRTRPAKENPEPNGSAEGEKEKVVIIIVSVSCRVLRGASKQ